MTQCITAGYVQHVRECVRQELITWFRGHRFDGRITIDDLTQDVLLEMLVAAHPVSFEYEFLHCITRQIADLNAETELQDYEGGEEPIDTAARNELCENVRNICDELRKAVINRLSRYAWEE